jgi:hypothetical protein
MLLNHALVDQSHAESQIIGIRDNKPSNQTNNNSYPGLNPPGITNPKVQN